MAALDLDKRYLIVGAGSTGQSVARYLRHAGAEFALLDSRPESPGLAASEFAGVTMFSDGFKACRDRQFDVLVVSPGISLRTPEIVEAQHDGVMVVGDIELFARALRALPTSPPVLAVTGSNGKSTVVSMLAKILHAAGIDAAAGGNLGTPALDLLAAVPHPAAYLLELSSFQLESTRSLALAAGSVLNVSEDHMDRYTTLDDYAGAKRQIYRHAQCCVYNAADSLTWPGTDKHSVAFDIDGATRSIYLIDDDALLCNGRALMPISELRVPGRHNAGNALAAVALAEVLPAPLRVGDAALRAGLRAFTGLPHRTQWVAACGGIDWYNDSKGTNVGATLAAITGLARPVVLIAGGDGKGADFSPLATIAEKYLRAAILIGRDAPVIARQLQGKADLYRESDMRAAVARARQVACVGDGVLLSPACASFDMYSNYQVRGDDFVAAVAQVLT